MIDMRLNTFINQIDSATTLDDLHQYHTQVVDLLYHDTIEREYIQQLYNDINTIHLALMTRALTLAEHELEHRQIGQRPNKWCWYLLGSGARMEQTIWTDQDNGILYECGTFDRTSCKAYIEEFAKIGTEYLNEIGFPFCDGNIMATNARWSQEIGDFILNFQKYVTKGFPEDISYLYILSDIQAIYGDAELVTDLKKTLFHTLNQSADIKIKMQEHLKNPIVPLGVFGQVFTQRWGENSGQVDVKYGLYVPIVNSMKYLAIRMKMTHSSTIRRIDELKHLNVLSEEQYQSVYSAFNISLYFRFISTMTKNDHNYHLSLKNLTKSDKMVLKKAMKDAKKIQQFAQHWSSDLNE